VTLVLEGAPLRESRAWSASELVEGVEMRVAAGVPKKQAIGEVADEAGVPKRDVYQAVVDAQGV
jgi:16S rRNA (cytidine1402-2'-O)-methyltransferase